MFTLGLWKSVPCKKGSHSFPLHLTIDNPLNKTKFEFTEGLRLDEKSKLIFCVLLFVRFLHGQYPIHFLSFPGYSIIGQSMTILLSGDAKCSLHKVHSSSCHIKPLSSSTCFQKFSSTHVPPNLAFLYTVLKSNRRKWNVLNQILPISFSDWHGNRWFWRCNCYVPCKTWGSIFSIFVIPSVFIVLCLKRACFDKCTQI